VYRAESRRTLADPFSARGALSPALSWGEHRGVKIMRATTLKMLAILASLIGIGLFLSNAVFAHCDGLDGPVVKAAEKALETENVNLVLIWVQKKDEGEIKKAFQNTLDVRKLSPQAKELADMYFFETLVRIHRAGEGAPYTGLKPAGRDLGPAIPAADKAIESGKPDALLKLLRETVQAEVQKKFEQLMAKKKYDPGDVETGREFIEAYTVFVEQVERIFETTKGVAESHTGGAIETGTAAE